MHGLPAEPNSGSFARWRFDLIRLSSPVTPPPKPDPWDRVPQAQSWITVVHVLYYLLSMAKSWIVEAFYSTIYGPIMQLLAHVHHAHLVHQRVLLHHLGTRYGRRVRLDASFATLTWWFQPPRQILAAALARCKDALPFFGFFFF